MTDYKKVPTTVEVWLVIIEMHHDQLKVFSTFSAPSGNPHGNPDEGQMLTEYGFEGGSCPLIGAYTRWDIDHQQPHERLNEHTDYWLCVPLESEKGE